MALAGSEDSSPHVGAGTKGAFLAQVCVGVEVTTRPVSLSLLLSSEHQAEHPGKD